MCVGVWVWVVAQGGVRLGRHCGLMTASEVCVLRGRLNEERVEYVEAMPNQCSGWMCFPH